MKPIQAQQQVRLGVRKGLNLALSGMSYRLFRSSITTAILALAVAFLVYTLSHGILAREAKASAFAELAADRALGERLTRLGRADSEAAIAAALAGESATRHEEIRRFCGCPLPIERARTTARELGKVAHELSELPRSARTALLGDRAPDTWLSTVNDEQALREFQRKLQSLGLSPPLGDFAKFERLVTSDQRELRQLLVAASAGHRRSVEALSRRYPAQAPTRLLASPPAELAAALDELGFVFEQGELEALSRFARQRLLLETVARLLRNEPLRAAIAREAAMPLGTVSLDTVANYVDSEAKAEWLSSVLRSTQRGTENGLAAADGPAANPLPEASANEIHRALEQRARERRLSSLAAEVPTRPLWLGLDEGTVWLIALSLLVCVVGVANALLMSVTERFTEIATMKCLGAMDGFVMMVFVFEAAIQGALGGLVGVVLGTLLAVLRSAVEFGALLVQAEQALVEVAVGSLASIGLAVVLAAIAAVGPAFIAARLPPMEAMRVD